MAPNELAASDFDVRVVFAHLADAFNVVAWSPDGKTLASGS